MRKSRSQYLIISLCLLGTILLISGAYIVYRQRRPAREQATGISSIARKETASKEHSKEIKLAVELTIPTGQLEPPIPIEDMQVVPRVTTAAVMRAPRVTTTTVLEFSAVPIKHDVRVNPKMPKVHVVPEIVTYPNTPKTASPEGMALSASASVLAAPTTGKDIVDKHIRVARGPMKPKGLSMIKDVTVLDTGLADVAQAVRLGKLAVSPLPKGEPGGRVIGRGKDIEGVFRLVRIHHDLADWWADQSSLVALTDWLNSQTKIKTDMNVEGGSLRLTDPKLSKAPLAFFTGHDPAMVRSYNLARGAPIRSRLSEPERDALRRYLIEDGGFIFFDDCGVNAPAQAFLRLVLAQLQWTMPEYSVDRITNDHEIYHNYYDMGEPPVGFDIFWWGTHPPKRNFLEGITIGDHLGILVCRRDYMCSMRTVSAPSWPTHYSPGVYRFSTNVVVYALTHGGISDYSHYIPEDTTADRISIEAPIVVPTLE